MTGLAVTEPAPVFRQIPGQHRAIAILAASVAHPVHAYLFSGPPGTGKREAATAFAAALVCPVGGCGECPSCRAVVSGHHPDVVVVEREGAAISVDEARRVAGLAQRTPSVSRLQVIVLADFHLVDRAAPALLKTIEEPPSSTVFVVLADSVPPSLVTIASRCVGVEFVPLETSVLAATLEAEGSTPTVAAAAAAAAHGRLDRARLLAADSGFASRQRLWRAVPERLDGTGATVALLAEELLSGADELVGVLRARQAEEMAQLEQAAERLGERHVAGRAAIEDRHKREQRRVRTDELRAGLATLAEAYRSRLASANVPPRRLAELAKACGAIDEAAAMLIRNPNEALLLQALLLGLGAASA
jgi:DNA polymerase-3 subunit delta'